VRDCEDWPGSARAGDSGESGPAGMGHASGTGANGAPGVQPRLHQMLQGIPNVHAQDADRQDTGSAGDDADQGLDLVHLRHQFFLLFLLVIGGFVEENLVFFVPCEIGTINKKDEQERDDCRPHDPNNRHVAQNGAHKRLGGTEFRFVTGGHREAAGDATGREHSLTGATGSRPRGRATKRLSRLLVPGGSGNARSGLGGQEGPSGEAY